MILVDTWTGCSPAKLTPALELDTAMIEFTSLFEKKWLPTYVSIQQNIWASIWKAKGCGSFSKRRWPHSRTPFHRTRLSLELGKMCPERLKFSWQKSFGSRVWFKGWAHSHHVMLHTSAILLWGLIRAAYGDLANDIAALAQAWARVVDVLSAPLYEEWEDDNHAALLSNIKGGLKYVHLVDHAPKLGKVFKECVTNSLTTINSTVPNFVYYRFPLVETNFTRVARHCDSDPATYSLANNG